MSKIAMLAPFGIRPKGTLLARMLPLAQALVQRGHQVQIIAPPLQNPQDAGQTVSYQGVPVTHTPRPNLPGFLGFWQQVRFLAAQTAATKPDLIHLFKPKGFSGLAALYLRISHPKLPLVVDTDDWEGWGGWNDLLPYPRWAKTLFAWQEKDLPRRAAAVTVASRTLETQVWGFGLPPERVFYLPNGINFSAEKQLLAPNQPFLKQNENLRLLLYTRFWEFDLRDLILALIIICQHAPKTQLMVIGRGENGEERELFRLAQRAGIAKALDYRGWQEPNAIAKLLTEAEIALMPLNDSLINRARCSAKLLELMAAGLPLVATRVGQVTEYLQERESGLLVAPNDPVGLAQAVLLLHTMPQLRQQLSTGAAQAAKRYTWAKLALIAEQTYQLASQT